MKLALPPCVDTADLKKPSANKAIKDRATLGKRYFPKEIRFLRTKRYGWVLAIQPTDESEKTKSYFIVSLEKKKVRTITIGPHLEKDITVFMSEDNKHRLKEYALLWQDYSAALNEEMDVE